MLFGHYTIQNHVWLHRSLLPIDDRYHRLDHTPTAESTDDLFRIVRLLRELSEYYFLGADQISDSPKKEPTH